MDTVEVLGALVVTPANVQDHDDRRLAWEEFHCHVKFQRIVCADRAYFATATWAWTEWPWLVELVRRPRRHLELHPKR